MSRPQAGSRPTPDLLTPEEAERERGENERMGLPRYEKLFAGQCGTDWFRFEFFDAKNDRWETAEIELRTLNTYEMGEVENVGKKLEWAEDKQADSGTSVRMARDLDPKEIWLKHGVGDFRVPDCDPAAKTLLYKGAELVWKTPADFKTPSQRVGFFTRWLPEPCDDLVKAIRRHNGQSDLGNASTGSESPASSAGSN